MLSGVQPKSQLSQMGAQQLLGRVLFSRAYIHPTCSYILLTLFKTGTVISVSLGLQAILYLMGWNRISQACPSQRRADLSKGSFGASHSRAYLAMNIIALTVLVATHKEAQRTKKRGSTSQLYHST